MFTKQAQKDAKKLAAAGLKQKAQELLTVLATNPYQTPPPYEKLVGDLTGAYSRRINIQHRLVYRGSLDGRLSGSLYILGAHMSSDEVPPCSDFVSPISALGIPGEAVHELQLRGCGGFRSPPDGNPMYARSPAGPCNDG
jgi:toxin YoeB